MGFAARIPLALAIIKYWPMSQTALHPWLASGEAQTGQYNGVETALRFSTPADELAALRTGCGAFALAWRAWIHVNGKDRVRWLHNMVTNNVRDLAVNRGNYNFVLNAQGRILGDLYIFNRGESLLLETDATQAEPLLNAMKRYIIMDKVELTPAGTITALGVCGPQAEKVLSAAGLDAGGMPPLELRDLTVDGLPVTLKSGPANRHGWFELWLGRANEAFANEPPANGPPVNESPANKSPAEKDAGPAQGLWSKLIHSGAQPVGAEALELWRVLRGIPQYGQDIRDRDLPQETGQLQALHFTKGCYIGQEIVERIRSRGHVHRTFTGFEFPGPAPSLDKSEPDRRALAEVTSLARVPTAAGDKNIGLGYVRREVLDASPEIDLNGIAATVVELPFEI
jgi:folate-binding protein YgfZ